MTTAHRPTWKAAVGRADEGGWSAGGAGSKKRSALDAPAHTALKLLPVVDRKEALKKSLLALEEAESSVVATIKQQRRLLDPKVEERAQQRLLQHTAEVDDKALKEKYDDSDIDNETSGSKADSEGSDLDAEDSDLDGTDTSDDDEDDEAALEAELAKIRAERAEAKRKAEEAADAEENAKQEEAALLGNPLLNDTIIPNRRMKRKWNDGALKCVHC